MNYDSAKNKGDMFCRSLVSLEHIRCVECEYDNHCYSSWYESVSFENYKGSSFKNKIWCRRCMKCGYVDFTFVKPEEIIKIENEEKKKIKTRKIEKISSFK